MYGNGGYMMLDFKNTSITNNAIKIDGINFDAIVKSKKPIIVSNVKSIDGVSGFEQSFAISRVTQSNIIYLWCMITDLVILTIKIDSNNNITSGRYTQQQVSSLNIKSEVSTNASKSDSNISK